MSDKAALLGPPKSSQNIPLPAAAPVVPLLHVEEQTFTQSI